MDLKLQEFVGILEKAFVSPNNTERNENFHILNNVKEKKPELICEMFLQALTHENSDNKIKRIVILALNQYINVKKASNTKSLWCDINQNQKGELYNIAFSILVSGNDEIKERVADLIASIYLLDLETDKMFNDLLKRLSENVVNQDKNVQKASILTIGFVCSNMQHVPDIQLSPENVEFLLSGIFLGLKEYNELSLTTVNSLLNSLDYIKPKLEE